MLEHCLAESQVNFLVSVQPNKAKKDDKQVVVKAVYNDFSLTNLDLKDQREQYFKPWVTMPIQYTAVTPNVAVFKVGKTFHSLYFMP